MGTRATLTTKTFSLGRLEIHLRNRESEQRSYWFKLFLSLVSKLCCQAHVDRGLANNVGDIAVMPVGVNVQPDGKILLLSGRTLATLTHVASIKCLNAMLSTA